MNQWRSGRLAILTTLALVATIIVGACGDKSETGNQSDVQVAAVGTPRWIVEQFFAQDSFPQAGLYLDSAVKATYEESGTTFGSSLAPGVEVKIRLLEGDTLTSTFAVQIADSNTAFDIYCYMDRGPDGWKLSTLRSLSGTGLLWSVVAELDTMATIPDSMRYIYDNCKMTISSDSTLKAFLTNHLAQFDEIVSALNSNHITTRIPHNAPAESSDPAHRQVAEMLRGLHLASVEADSTGRVEVLVGGIGDNLVCFVYVPEGDEPPRIDRDNIIYAEPVTDRWYVFKTT